MEGLSTSRLWNMNMISVISLGLRPDYSGYHKKPHPIIVYYYYHYHYHYRYHYRNYYY